LGYIPDFYNNEDYKMKNVIVIASTDNVAVATEELIPGDMVTLPNGESLIAVTNIPFGHKIATTAISRNSDVIKYGESIGKMSCDIKAGEWVHTHNMIIVEEGE